VFSERAKSRSQDFAIKAVLAAEVVIDGGLIDPRLSDDGADTGLFITAIRKQTHCSFEDALARDVRWSCHPGPHFSNPRLNLMSHYDDIAANNFAFCWSSGEISLFLPALAEKRSGSAPAQCALWMVLISPAKIKSV
jgi:hypothetical protein